MILPGSRKSAYLESDSDPELLIHIEFLQAVKIKSIAFFAGVSPEQGPKTVHLFINQPQFDFNDVDSHTPTQELTLTDKDIKGEKVDLRFVRFQSVNSLHVRHFVSTRIAVELLSNALSFIRSLLKIIREVKRRHASTHFKYTEAVGALYWTLHTFPQSDRTYTLFLSDCPSSSSDEQREADDSSALTQRPGFDWQRLLPLLPIVFILLKTLYEQFIAP